MRLKELVRLLNMAPFLELAFGLRALLASCLDRVVAGTGVSEGALMEYIEKQRGDVHVHSRV